MKFKIIMSFIIVIFYLGFGFLIIPTLIPIGKIIITKVLIVGTLATLIYNWLDEIKSIFKKQKKSL